MLPLLLLAVALGAAARPSSALSPHVGPRVHLAILGIDVQNPVFHKEFTTGPQVETFGGDDELYLPVKGTSLGLRFGYEHLNRKRVGLGLNLTLWRVDFENAAFLYDREGAQQLIARYRDPAQTYGVLDVTGTYLAWASRDQALGLYGMLSLAWVHESYTIEHYRVVEDLSERLGLTSADRSQLEIRPGLGFGLRLHLRTWLSLWAEARWLAGQAYTRPARQLPDGTSTPESRQRLYASTRSVGIALGF